MKVESSVWDSGSDWPTANFQAAAIKPPTIHPKNGG